MATVSNGNAVELHLQPKQSEAFLALEHGEAESVLYGGAKGGGKSRFVRDWQIYRRSKYPGTWGLIVRRTFDELKKNHIEKMFTERPGLRELYKAEDHSIRWPNGSITFFKYLERTDDVYRQQGIEYADVTVDECTQHEEKVFQVLKTSVRLSPQVKELSPDLRGRCLLTGNPGGIGHAWVKRLFIDRQFRPEEGERPQDYAFVQAKIWDNRLLLEADPEYLQRLENLPEDLRRAYLDGDWNVFAGQYLKGLRPSKHLVEDFRIPLHWARFRSLDWGFAHPTVVCWFAVAPNGQCYIYKHYKKNQVVSTVMARNVVEMSKDEKILQTVAGHDLWQSVKHDEQRPTETVADLVAREKLYCAKAVIDRVPGWQLLREYLDWEDGKRDKPRLQIMRSCTPIYDGLARLIYAETGDVEDVKKMDGDDEGDCVRYGVQYLHSIKPPETPDGQVDEIINSITVPGVRIAFAGHPANSTDGGDYDDY